LNDTSNKIQDIMLQSNMKMLEQDMLMRQMEYEGLLKRSEQTMQVGMAGASQYMEMLTNNRMMALESYATQLNTIVQNNAQTLQQYGMELERITSHAEITYKSIMAEIGYDEHLMQQSEDYYNQYMQPYYDKMEAWYQAEELRIAEKAAEGDGLWGFVSDIVGWGIAILGIVVGNPAVVAAGAGVVVAE